LQVRSASASGPLNQQPGLLLVGGSDEVAPQAPAAPPQQVEHSSTGNEPISEELRDLLFSTGV
jgi:hypothetical protein